MLSKGKSIKALIYFLGKALHYWEFKISMSLIETSFFWIFDKLDLLFWENDKLDLINQIGGGATWWPRGDLVSQNFWKKLLLLLLLLEIS